MSREQAIALAWLALCMIVAAVGGAWRRRVRANTSHPPSGTAADLTEANEPEALSDEHVRPRWTSNQAMPERSTNPRPSASDIEAYGRVTQFLETLGRETQKDGPPQEPPHENVS